MCTGVILAIQDISGKKNMVLTWSKEFLFIIKFNSLAIRLKIRLIRVYIFWHYIGYLKCLSFKKYVVIRFHNFILITKLKNFAVGLKTSPNRE